ncbi:MAG: type I DNA topoisomerase [Lachnospiraceae bacterium]|nr:type I DNA topoisomerase [Lachnospiraceae bacterium]
MAKNLVIVESPAKAKTIKKFLGNNYEVIASNGHVRDLPKSSLGIDVNNGFEPKYITIRGKGDLLAMLRKETKKADKIFLATDPDREGEAISWHLVQALKLENKKYSRISFNEITKNAVKNSIKNARSIDTNLVDSQQARRMLDRLVGYEISPILWEKVKRGLSAGRVQSVALRIICDREEEINAFEPQEYWSLDGLFNIEGIKKPVRAKFYGTVNEKLALAGEEDVKKVLKELDGADFAITDVKISERSKKAPVPFTTSTLQQEASKTLNFATAKTMRIAQQLYEGVDIKGKGTIGLISYLRTDSTRVSDEADAAAKEYIKDNFGENFVTNEDVNKGTNKKIQDAHEAIRPTYFDLSPTVLKEQLTRDQFRLYQLIWKRFIASRMKAATYETTSVKIDGNGYRFTAAGSKLKFEGFMSVYNSEEEEQQNIFGSNLTMNSKVKLDKMENQQHFTQPPAHFTEASLVKALEELGIGRPSTYAPTITTLLGRRYIIKENKNIYVTELGESVNVIMKSAFTSIVDVTFTANFETLLDAVETGDISWKTVVSNFYPDFKEALDNARDTLEKVKIEDEVTDVVCEQCGANMVIKYGPHGKFLACPSFPDCRNTKPYLEKIGVSCPKCGKDIVVKKTKKGRRFFGCEDFTNCDFMSWQKPYDMKCPDCGNICIERGNKIACIEPKCGFSCSKPKSE